MNRRNAFILMLDAHAGQTDKAGEPYFFHALEVEEAVAQLGEDFSVAALLHDVFEDTDRKVEDYLWLPDHGMAYDAYLTPLQAEALTALTKLPGESEPAYMKRVLESFIAHVVKWADNRRNANAERIAKVRKTAPQTADRLTAKYERGRLYLLGLEAV